jgi:hypothetical protein
MKDFKVTLIIMMFNVTYGVDDIEQTEVIRTLCGYLNGTTRTAIAWSYGSQCPEVYHITVTVAKDSLTEAQEWARDRLASAIRDNFDSLGIEISNWFTEVAVSISATS